jgi:Leucine-rich repeat (LRR) protein
MNSNSGEQEDCSRQHLWFCDLPLETMRCIFLYLSSKEIGFFDSALTNKIHRKRFLDALDGFSFDQMIYFTDSDYQSEILWCISRRIVFTSLRLESQGPWYFDLIERTHNKIQNVDINIFNLEAGSILYSLLGKCSNLSTITFDCPITDRDLEESLRNKKQLKSLDFNNCHSLTSASIQIILNCCPRLESLTFYRVPFVNDECLRSLLEGLHNLNFLDLSHVSISDRSMELMVKTNRAQEIVYWDDCREVSWEGKLFYLREIHLPQLLSEDEEQQVKGLNAFLEMIPFRSLFPLEHYLSMGVFTRLGEISTLNERHNSIRFNISVIRLFHRVVDSGYFDLIHDFTHILININLTFNHDQRNSWELMIEFWLQCLQQISETPTQCQYLISQGILSKLMTLAQSVRLYCHL